MVTAMLEADRATEVLIHLIRLLREERVSAASRVERLYSYLFENPRLPERKWSFSTLESWDSFELSRTLDMAEDIIARYTQAFHDPRVLPVTYYKRERRVRRQLDQEFSRLFKELIGRARRPFESVLVIEEPIYFLTQQAREKRFPRSKDGRASLAILRTRLHLELSRHIDTGPESRKVLLPYEIR